MDASRSSSTSWAALGGGGDIGSSSAIVFWAPIVLWVVVLGDRDIYV